MLLGDQLFYPGDILNVRSPPTFYCDEHLDGACSRADACIDLAQSARGLAPDAIWRSHGHTPRAGVCLNARNQTLEFPPFRFFPMHGSHLSPLLSFAPAL